MAVVSNIRASLIIPCDNGAASVVRSFPPTQGEHTSAEDQQFAKLFKKIFVAAAYGSLKNCEKIVKKGFNDVDAFSIGIFVDQKKKPFNYISPRQVAQMNGNSDIVKYFAQQFGGPPESDKQSIKE